MRLYFMWRTFEQQTLKILFFTFGGGPFLLLLKGFKNFLTVKLNDLHK